MTSEQLIKSLTVPQRKMFERLQKGKVIAPLLSSERRPIRKLIELKLAEPTYAGGGLHWQLTDFGKLIAGPVVCAPS